MHKKNASSKSGMFTFRIIIAVALCSLGASVGWISFASTPSAGTLSPATPLLTYDAGPFNVPNQSPLGLGQLDTGPRCDAADPCDSYALAVNLPGGYAAAHPLGGIKITMYWTDTGSGQSNYDLYVYNGTVGDLDGMMPANHQSSSGSNPEVAVINPLIDGATQYTLKIVPNTPTQETVHVRIELLPGTGGLNPSFGGPDPTAPGTPRYQIFAPPGGTNAESSRGEFNIGFNPATKRIMVMNSGPIWRLTPNEVKFPGQPECCEALWEEKTATSTNTPANLDPILWTDQLTGRTFASNSTAGANASYAYSDSDGEPTPTSPTGWTEFGFSPPDAGADHETIGSGPYPLIPNPIPGGSPLPNPASNPVNHGQMVFYCSQDVVGPASCQRSNDLGVSYGGGVVVYTGNGLHQTVPGVPGGPCGGLHGHIHVAPDGTVWLPVNQCGGLQGGVFSTDGGITWTNFTVPGAISQIQGADPSIAIDADSNIYYAYVNNEAVSAGNPPEGHARVAKGHRNADNTITWTNFFDLGASHAIRNAAEIEAVGGSSGRAAVGFFGTDVNGDYQANTFPGKWYPFISTTTDGGATWTTVNATPNDPIQSMTGIWQQGGGALDRNLLDFNEITIDDKGRVLFGYSDGCVTPDCRGGGAPNDFVAYMRVARQSGGKTLFASFDSQTDTTVPKLPKAACLSGARDPLASHLSWRIPDNGGADIQKYEIWRGTGPGNETLLFTTLNADPKYTDINPPSDQHLYYYVKAINSVGTSGQSNEIDLVSIVPPVPASVCVLPGLTKLTDPAGDPSLALGFVPTPAPPGADLLSFQLAQPYSADGVSKLIFTINTDPGQSPQPVGSAWYVAMKINDPPPATTFHYRGVHMAWKTSPANTPVFESYTPGPNNSGGVDGRFVDNAQPIIPADASSSYVAPFNKIVIVVKATDLGLQPGDVISGFVSGVTQTSNPVGTGPAATTLYDQMPDSLSFANSYVVAHNNVCAPLAPGVVSRKTHGAAGPFDLTLPTNGNAAIEPRSGGPNNAYTVIYTFGTNLAFAGTAAPTQGTATVSPPAIGPNLNQVTVDLTNVTDVQHLVIGLTGAQDANHAPLTPQTARMDVVVGDVNGNGLVNSTDTSLAQIQSGKPVTVDNFRMDVNANGVINSTDTSIVQSKSGTGFSATTPTSSQQPPSDVSSTTTTKGRKNERQVQR